MVFKNIDLKRGVVIIKKIAKRACATLLASTILTSTLSLSSISVFATEAAAQADKTTNVQATEQSSKEADEQSDKQAHTQEDFRAYATGDLSLQDDTHDENIDVIRTTDEYYSIANNGIGLYSNPSKLKSTPALPESYDNSTGENKKYFPPIGDQGGFGACVCWAQVYCQYSYTVNKMLDREATYHNSFSPKFAYNLLNQGTDSGVSCFDVYTLLMKQGAPSLETLPYDNDCFSWSYSEDAWTEAPKYRLKSYQEIALPDDSILVSDTDDKDLNLLKTILANGEVLAFTAYIYSSNISYIKYNPDIPENDKFLDEDVITCIDGTDGSHRLALVGYNDNIWIDVNNNNKVDNGEMGAFKVANSWGKNVHNDGFMWVAYDALNSVSSVKGVEVSTHRERAFQEIYRIDVTTDNPEPHIFLKYTVNSATRTKTPIKIVAERYSTRVNEYLAPYNVTWCNNLSGTEFSYNGTHTSADATFLADLTQYFPEINSDNISEYSISAVFSDQSNDYNPLTVKNVEIIDTKTNKVYKPSNFQQFTLNGAEKCVDILDCRNKAAVIYYKGFITPYIEYKIEDGSWESAPGYAMQINSEADGYSHKYVIPLDKTEHTVSVRIHDGNGNYDTDIYTVYAGVNRIQSPDIEPQEIRLNYKTNLPDDGTIDSTQLYILELSPEGGFAPYRYKFIDTNVTNNTTFEGNFSANSNTAHILYTTPGEYIYTVTVQDQVGNQATLSFNLTAKLPETAISHFKISPDKDICAGDVCVFDALTEHEDKTIDVNDYRIDIYNADGNTFCQSLDVKNELVYVNGFFQQNMTKLFASWRPLKEGSYIAYLTVKDGNEKITTTSLTFDVQPATLLEIESFDTSPESLGGFFEIVNMRTNAASGSGNLKYQFSYIKDGTEIIVQDYSYKNTASLQFGMETGSYELITRVQDPAGFVDERRKTFTVVPTYASRLVFSEPSIKTGESVTITPVINNESSALNAMHYNYTVTKDGVTTILTTSEDKTVTWKPKEAGDYVINLQVKYAGNTLVNISKSYTVEQGPKQDNTLYFIPGESWKEANARFAIYTWNNSSSIWVSLEEKDGVYFTELSDEYSDMIFCRMNPATTNNNWNTILNQTADIKRPADKNCFTLNPNEWYNATGTWSVYNPETSSVSITGDITLALKETESNIFTGTTELQAGTYSFNVDSNGTTLGMNYTYTDTATIDYSAGYKTPSKLVAKGGRYTFTYNASTKILKIKYKAFDDIVELFGDINVELVKSSKDSTVYTGSARIEAGTYSFKINDQGTKMGFGFAFDDVVYDVEYKASYSSATTFNATGGIYSVKYDTATNKLTFRHAPKGLGDVRIFGDINLPLAGQGNNIYSATKTLDTGIYQFRIDSLGTTVCNGYEFTNGINGAEYKAEWKGATTLRVTAKQKFTFIFDTATNRIKVLGSPIDTTKVLVAFEDSTLELKSTDGVNYKATTALEAGTYSFRIDEFGVTLGYGGTFTDSISGIKYNTGYLSATAFTATGGSYRFSYNVNTDVLKVTKL
ncbi:MAG: carbohydrate binding domain-containing protein [Acutalibacteraceae bacterium]|nr:carbohydrate binding domain-containing protein [Acutalibacteraceae bacterium]